MESLPSLARMPDNPTRSGGFTFWFTAQLIRFVGVRAQGVIARLQSSCEKPNRKGISLCDATRIVGV
jgi:hypothetical protein